MSGDPSGSSGAGCACPPAGLRDVLACRLELLEELGSGASGTVYRARTRAPLPEVEAGAQVAVKFLRRDLLRDPVAARRLEREGELGLRVRSPHVVRIFAKETVRILGLDTTYLVMELLRGRTLRHLLRDDGPPHTGAALRIASGVARGLAALHEHGIAHRDVKPENVFLTREGRVKLMDLDLACAGSCRSAGFVGSLASAAPELLRGGTAGSASDLYAFGIVLYELVAGRHPFAGASNDDVLHGHLERTPAPLSRLRPDVAPWLARLISELLAKDPRRRPPSARVVAALASVRGQ